MLPVWSLCVFVFLSPQEEGSFYMYKVFPLRQRWILVVVVRLEACLKRLGTLYFIHIPHFYFQRKGDGCLVLGCSLNAQRLSLVNANDWYFVCDFLVRSFSLSVLCWKREMPPIIWLSHLTFDLVAFRQRSILLKSQVFQKCVVLVFT